MDTTPNTYLDKCTLKQACDWIIEHKKPTLPFDTNDDLPENCSQDTYNRHLNTASKRILKAVFNKYISITCLQNNERIDITNILRNYPKAILDIEKNAIFCPTGPKPLSEYEIYHCDYIFEDIQIPFKELEHCFETPLISQTALINYTLPDFPDNVRISEYMQVALELLKDGCITTEKVMKKPALERRVRAKFEEHKIEITDRAVERIMFIIRPIESQKGYAFHNKKK